ncbi:hypothetical protein [Bdellovibrio bacteriovorus]|uniref:hypothetical protein n=1 Tax=Bdellovibrio TaxID=958 RepID=UPI0035A82DD4
MKTYLFAFLMTFSFQSFAGNPECLINAKPVELLPVVHPKADLASYVFDQMVGDFDVRIVLVDGAYIASVRKGDIVMTQNWVESLDFNVNSSGETISIQCP